MRSLSLLRLLVLGAVGCNGVIAVTPPDPPLCEDPVELGDGYVRCANGAVDRIADTTHDPLAGRLEACTHFEANRSCEWDTDCTDGPNGQCSHFDDLWDAGDSCGCTYGCASDADCDPGEACLGADQDPARTWASCVPATCRASADCESGSCGVAHWYDGCSTTSGLMCRTDLDTCAADSECETDTCGSASIDEGATFSCSEADCVVGRPFRVEGHPTTAPPARRSDWTDAADVSLPHDEEVARYWTWVASFEHASVASFSMVALQLLALGAPPELIDATHQAGRDEIRHARAMYALASKVGGQAVGPGPLELTGLSLSTDVHHVLESLVREACINETLSAALAGLDAEAAADPGLRRVLRGIADDEARHAELAWRTLHWLLGVHPQLRGEALRLLEDATTRIRAAAPSTTPDRPVLGVVGPLERQRFTRRVVEAVIEPAIEALR